MREYGRKSVKVGRKRAKMGESLYKIERKLAKIIKVRRKLFKVGILVLTSVTAPIFDPRSFPLRCCVFTAWENAKNLSCFG